METNEIKIESQNKDALNEAKNEKRKSNSGKNILVAAIFMSAFFGGIFGFLGGKMAERPVPAKNTEIVKEKESAVIDVVEKSSPAVVSIVVSKDMPKFRNFFDQRDFFDLFMDPFGGSEGNGNNEGNTGETEKQKIGGGTGFFISKDGLIVTNKHVVEDQEAEYTVVMKDDKEYKAQVLARHPNLDIAVIKIEGEQEFPVLNLGDSDKLKVGQSVVAIGNSLGEFSNSVSLGIISGLQRNITASAGFGQSEKLNNIIQTDAAINPGNSGGPLLDITGEVIGINVAVASGAQSVGFALPINQVKNIVEQVKKEGKITIPYIGVRYVLINKEIQEANNLDYDYGALIARGERITDLAVIPGSPADKAGIVENDIILEINGEKIDEKNMLNDLISKYNVGDEVELKIWHKGEEKTVKVVLTERKGQ